MPKITIPYQKTGYFSGMINDYLSENEKLKYFYNRFPKLSEFKNQIAEKEKTFSQSSRDILVERLKLQYNNIELSEASKKNIESLKNKNTFTITTGHQLNLFTGPLYFHYKIFSVINLSEKLNTENPENHFVPVYWMATEDHDFDEINYFNLFGKKIHWNREDGGAVGELSTEGLEAISEIFNLEIGNSENAKYLKNLFAEAYINHQTLTDATRYLADQLFRDYGLVILDGNDKELKKAFVPYAKGELGENLAFKKISKTTEKLMDLGYAEQVHPREINLFYLKNGLRERIIEQEGTFYVNETEIVFTKDEIFAELNKYPERFSPNALLRPLFQEVILPNLCYVGGGGELAYWFQLKDYFETVEIPFPILLLRNSVLLVPEKFSKKLDALNVDIESLFKKQSDLKTEYTKQISEIEIDFTKQKQLLKDQFKELYKLAEKTDASFIGAVGAQEKKQKNGLDNLEKRLLKAQKRKLNDAIERLLEVQDLLFPNQSLQERTLNFSEFYLQYGEKLFTELKEHLDPLENEFTILEV